MCSLQRDSEQGKIRNWAINCIYCALHIFLAPMNTRHCLTERLLMGRKESNQILEKIEY